MTAEDLASRHSTPIRAGTPPLTEEQVGTMLPLLPAWEVRDGKSLRRRFRFDDFAAAMVFVNAVAKLAEAEDHHPDLLIQYDRVRLDLSTHSIGGLSENDFIVAAKIDRLPDIAAKS